MVAVICHHPLYVLLERFGPEVRINDAIRILTTGFFRNTTDFVDHDCSPIRLLLIAAN